MDLLIEASATGELLTNVRLATLLERDGVAPSDSVRITTRRAALGILVGAKDAQQSLRFLEASAAAEALKLKKAARDKPKRT